MIEYFFKRKKYILLYTFFLIVLFGACLTIKYSHNMREGDTIKLTVEKCDGNEFFSSDNGEKWENHNKPPFFMYLKDRITNETSAIPVYIVNDSDDVLSPDNDFSVYLLKNGKWTIIVVEKSRIDFGFHVKPHTTCETICDIGSSHLEKGHYMISKKITRDTDNTEWILSVDFYVH